MSKLIRLYDTNFYVGEESCSKDQWRVNEAGNEIYVGIYKRGVDTIEDAGEYEGALSLTIEEATELAEDILKAVKDVEDNNNDN
jgi:hypothetical protein